jgi:hypothetical protein
MTARQVHSVLAAGAQRPDLIAKWQRDPRLLLAQGIEPGAIDLTALWKFAGLTVKVRHNGLRNDFPMTFRLMSLAGLEIELFASYATCCASKGRALAATSEERARDFIAFLEQMLDFRTRPNLLLWDLIRHEQALALLNKSVTARSSDMEGEHPASSRNAISGSTVPVIRGTAILHEMRCVPRAVELELFQNPPQLGKIPLDGHRYCYWRSEAAAGIHILEVDEFSYHALSFIDGLRTTSELSLRLGGGRRPTVRFLRALGELAAIGILDFKENSKTGLT